MLEQEIGVHRSQLVEGSKGSIERFLVFFAHVQNGVDMLQHCSLGCHGIVVLLSGKVLVLAVIKLLARETMEMQACVSFTCWKTLRVILLADRCWLLEDLRMLI